MKQMAFMGFSVYFMSCSMQVSQNTQLTNRKPQKKNERALKIASIALHLMAAKAKAF